VRPFRLSGLAWLLVGGGAGLLLALLPFQVGLALLALAALLLTPLITPLAPLGALLVLAPLRALVATEAPGQMPLDFGLLGFAAVMGSWLLRLTRRRRLLPLPVSPVLLALLPFVITTALSSYTAFSMSAWLNEWLKWAQMAVLVVICLDVVRGRAWQWLVFALVMAGAANAVLGIYQYFGGSGALHLLIDNRFYRAFGSFGQPNPFGGFMGLMLPLALAAALGYGWRWWRRIGGPRRQPWALALAAFYFACAALLAAGVLMSWSRGAWLGAAASAVVLVFAAPRRWWVGALLVALLAAGAGGMAALGLLPTSITDRVASAFSETFSITDVRGVAITGENYALVERLAHWQAAVNMATAHPWLGVGFGNYEAAYPEYRLIAWRFPLGHAHNYYLNVLAETGMIGVASFAGTWLLVLWLTWRTRAHRDLQAHLMAAGLLGAWAYLAVHSLTDNLFVNNLFIHVGCMLGLLAVLYHQAWHKTRVPRPA
jgi:O-antigen ligase